MTVFAGVARDRAPLGVLRVLRCKCDCGDVDKYVVEALNFVSGSWSATEQTAFNDELRKPVWTLTWPP
jgi:hypothetical protein